VSANEEIPVEIIQQSYVSINGIKRLAATTSAQGINEKHFLGTTIKALV